eukprot:2009761-Pleurochrysis_carterae.AAC.1
MPVDPQIISVRLIFLWVVPGACRRLRPPHLLAMPSIEGGVPGGEGVGERGADGRGVLPGMITC